MVATAVILAAGLGTRMKSKLAKVLHPIAGQPMLRHLLASAETVFDRVVVVVGPGMDDVAAAAAPHAVVVQRERLGTAHAASQAAHLFGDGDAAVLYADNPLIRPETMQALLDRRRSAALTLLAMRPDHENRYGRVIAEHGRVRKVVEWADATEAERAGSLCNAGVLCASARDMARWLADVRADNAKGEFYLTDVVALAAAEGADVAAVEAPYDELRGVNSRAELAQAEAVVQRRLRLAAMEGGATLADPATTYFCMDTRLGRDVTVEPGVVFGPGVTVADAVRIRAYSHLEGCTVAGGAVVGPFARLRPGAELGEGAHVGNFCEIKAASLGRGAKVNHLSYIGDASVGARTNVGAGTITCNYDGFAKHRTTIGADVFVGSDTAFVAPVSVGDGAMVAAGSVVTADVAADALVLARGRQTEKPGYAAAFRAARRKEAK